MALIKCTECGKEFSEYAEACPECGCPVDVVKAAIEEEARKEREEEELRLQKKQEEERLEQERLEAERLEKEKETARKQQLLENFTQDDLRKGRILAELVADTAVNNTYFHALITEDRAVISDETSHLKRDLTASLKYNFRPTNMGQWMFMEKIYAPSAGIADLVTIGITHSGQIARTKESWNRHDPFIKSLTFGQRRMYMLGKDGKIYSTFYRESAADEPKDKKYQENLDAFLQRIRTWENITKLSGAEYGLCGLRADGTCIVDGVDTPPVKKTVEEWTDLVYVVMSDDAMGLCKDGTVVCVNTDDDHAYDDWKGIIAIAKFNLGYIGIRIDGALVDKRGNVITEDCIGFCNRGWMKQLVVKKDGSIDEVYWAHGKWNVERWRPWKVFEDLRTYVAKYKVSRDACKEKTNPDAIAAAKAELEETNRNYASELKSAGFMQKKKVEKKYEELLSKKRNAIKELYKEPFAYDLVWYGEEADPYAAIKAMGQLYAGIYQPAPKDASVIKRAAAGAIIAGPAGAVVGALSAVDKNNRNRK